MKSSFLRQESRSVWSIGFDVCGDSCDARSRWWRCSQRTWPPCRSSPLEISSQSMRAAGAARSAASPLGRLVSPRPPRCGFRSQALSGPGSTAARAAEPQSARAHRHSSCRSEAACCRLASGGPLRTRVRGFPAVPWWPGDQHSIRWVQLAAPRRRASHYRRPASSNLLATSTCSVDLGLLAKGIGRRIRTRPRWPERHGHCTVIESRDRALPAPRQSLGRTDALELERLGIHQVRSTS